MSFDAFLDNIRSPSTTDPDRPKLTGGLTGDNPNVVQSKAAINALTATLPGSPSEGNLLVAIGTHWNNNAAAINGYTMHTMINGVTNAGIMVATKFAGPGESATQTPFSVGTSSNMIAVFEISGAMAVTEVNYIKESAANPSTVTGWASETDLVLGMFAQQVANNAFSLSGDTSTAIEDITGTSGADSPHRLQTFAYDPAQPAVSVSATLTAGATARMAGIVCAVSSQAFNRGRLAIGRFASFVAMGPRKPVGNFYFETDIVAVAGTPGVGVVSNLYATSGNWNALGSGTLNVVYNTNGQVRLNGATIATISAYTAGNRVSVAVNAPLRLIWFKVDAGSWNNDGTANPATAVGGIDISALTDIALIPAFSFSTTGSVMMACFEESEFIYTPPAGFSSPAEVVVTTGYNPSPVDTYAPFEGPVLPITYHAMQLPEENFSRAVSFPAGPIKLIAGEVRENNVGVEGRLVRLYNRRTGDYVGEARTDVDGNFIMPAQDPNLPHFVVAFDDDISPDYNAKIYDNVLPQ